MFESILNTDVGKYFVCQYEKTFDAQVVYRKLELHASASTQAAIDSPGLLSYLTSAKFDSYWRGTGQSFALNRYDKLRAYEDLIGIEDCFSDLVKLNLLQNTVAGVNILNQVMRQSAHEVAHGKPPLDYSQYKILLLSAASVYNSKQGLSQSRASMKIHEHQLPPPPLLTHNNDDGSFFMAQEHSTSPYHSFDIDTDVGTLSTYTPSSKTSKPAARPPKTMMSCDQWQALLQSDKSLWNQLATKSKAIIMGNTKPPPAPIPPAPNLQRWLILHDISLTDYMDIVTIHQYYTTSTNSPPPSDLGESTTSIVTSEETPSTGDSTSLLALAAKQTKKSSSQPSTATSTCPPGSSSSNSGLPGDIRQVLGGFVHQITYSASTHKANTYGSLVDCGAKWLSWQ